MRTRIIFAVFPGVVWLAAGVPAGGGTSRGDDDQQRRRTPIVEAYDRAKDSIVNISTTRKVEFFSWGIDFRGIFKVPVERSEQSVGSGFVIHEDGYIATNAHVVAQGAELQVTFANGDAYDARTVARDTTRDLAVIKIDADEAFTPIPLGRSDDLMIGEQTIAIGNPVGLQNTLTAGVISALHRELDMGGRVIYHDLIQTDASINHGNSGGPLLNVLGELIGINTAVRTDAQNIGFAIPVSQLRAVLPQILNSENVNKVQVGLRVSGTETVRVVEVRAGSPADEAGVELGDVVRAVDGKPLDDEVDFLVEMLDRKVGDRVHLDLVRGAQSTSATVSLTAVPRPDGQRLALERLGLRLTNISARTARDFGLRTGKGVVITGVAPRSPADRVGVEPGDMLAYIGDYRILDVDQVGPLLGQVEQDDPVDIEILRLTPRGLTTLQGRLYAR